MKLDWTKGVTGRELEERREMVKSARPTLNVLKNILDKKLAEVHTKMHNQRNYEYPSWPYMQADVCGEIRMLTYVIDLLTLDQEDKQ